MDRVAVRLASTVRAPSAVVLAIILLGAGFPGLALGQDGPRLFHLPLRWCVLEGTAAARGDPNRAVQTRIARGSSVLAPRAGITLRSPINRSLADSLGFPVIADPRTAIGRRGDVRVPVESSAEFWLVAQRCERAWDRLRRAAGGGSRFGAIARGPIAVIIRDFVGGNGQPFRSVWGYAFSANTNGGYCAAADPRVTSASGGFMLVVDSSDGFPSAASDRLLVAHEVGHILKLGHGDGLDNDNDGRIDKFCDDSENPDIRPGSFMTASLTYGAVTGWQRRLPRTVAAKHPAAVFDAPELIIPPRRWLALERIAHEGWRRVRRQAPGAAPRSAPGPRMRPLTPLFDTGTRGDDVPDALPPLDGPACADLLSMGVSTDEATGSIIVRHDTRGGICDDGLIIADGGIDSDGDPETGSPLPAPGGGITLPGSPPGLPPYRIPGGIDIITRTVIDGGVIESLAWRWDADDDAWIELLVPPVGEIVLSFGEDDEAGAGSGLVLSIDDPAVSLTDRFRMLGGLRTELADGRSFRDDLAGDDGTDIATLSLESVPYPVCGVDRDAAYPGHGDPGGMVTLETYGFGRDGPVSIFLGDAPEPIATGSYSEMVDDPWPWVAEIELPPETEDGLHMVHVTMDGTGLSADCPVVVGVAELGFTDAAIEGADQP